MSEINKASATTASPKPTATRVEAQKPKPSRTPINIKPTTAQTLSAIDGKEVAKDLLIGAGIGLLWPLALPSLLGCETPRGVSTEGFEELDLGSAVLKLNMSLLLGETVMSASYTTGDILMPYNLKDGSIWGRLMFENPAPFQNDAALIPEGIPKKDIIDGFPMVEDCEVEEGAPDYLGYCSYRGFTTVDSDAVDPNGRPVSGSILERANGDLITEYTYTDYSDFPNVEDKTYYFDVDEATGQVICGGDNTCDAADQIRLGAEEEDPVVVPFAFFRTNANGELKDEDNGLPVQFLPDETLRDQHADQRCWTLISASAPNEDGNLEVIDQDKLIKKAFPQYGIEAALGVEGLRAESVVLKDVTVTILDNSGRNIETEVINLGTLTATAYSDRTVIENFTFQIPERFYHPEAEEGNKKEGPKDLHYNIEILVEGKAQRASGGGLFPTYIYGGNVKLVFELSEDKNMPAVKQYGDAVQAEAPDGGVEDAGDAGVEEDLSETDANGEDR